MGSSKKKQKKQAKKQAEQIKDLQDELDEALDKEPILIQQPQLPTTSPAIDRARAQEEENARQARIRAIQEQLAAETTSRRRAFGFRGLRNVFGFGGGRRRGLLGAG